VAKIASFVQRGPVSVVSGINWMSLTVTKNNFFTGLHILN